eukprot:9635092-Alexandrium_andersonii.AAC.1
MAATKRAHDGAGGTFRGFRRWRPLLPGRRRNNAQSAHPSSGNQKPGYALLISLHQDNSRRCALAAAQSAMKGRGARTVRRAVVGGLILHKEAVAMVCREGIDGDP